MINTTRRTFTAFALALALAPTGLRATEEPLKEFRIGFQKTGLPVIARQQQSIEKRLAGQGIAVRWVEFTAGPPLTEALNVGSIDFGFTGDAPPIFAQAAGANLVYVAALPSNGAGEAIIVKPNSPIRSIADLKGRKVAFTKGSSAHNLAVVALEQAGIGYGDVTPVYLSPADAAAAFARDSVDAWSIWDPFFAIAQLRYQPRVLVTSKDLLKVNTYFLANRTFAAQHPQIVVAALDVYAEAAAWARDNRDKVARALAEVTGVELEAQTLAANRLDFAVLPLGDEIIANQQATADRFYKLGLIPKPIVVREAVWTRPQS